MRQDYLAIWDLSSDCHQDNGCSQGSVGSLALAHKGGCLSFYLNIACQNLRSGEGDAIIVGDLYQGTDPATMINHLRPEQWRRVQATSGEVLIKDYWGCYISFVIDNRKKQLHVLRDPSGSMPCFYQIDQSRIIFSSRADLIELVSLSRCEPDWSSLVTHIAWPMIRHELTSIKGISELLPGALLTAGSRGISTRQSWSPWAHTQGARTIPSWADAVAELRQRVIGCVGALSSQSSHTLLAVSGGLDSSIVAAALVASKRHFSCLTLYTEELIGDERSYARELTRHLKVDLHEEAENVEYVNIAASEARHLPRPVSRAFAQSGDRVHQELARKLGVDQFMTGGGGDNVFCFLHSAAPIADRLMTPAARLGSIRTLLDVARLNGVSVAAALNGAISTVRQFGLPHKWSPQAGFLSQAAREHLIIPPFHPWLAPPKTELPGKAMHVAWLVAIQNHLEGFGREWMHPLRAPLLAQPIVEHCLRIPTWFWCSEGKDRALAREAFADILPPAILNRRSKGTPTGFVIQLLDENRTFIRERLLEGLLAAEGIIDRAKVEAFFGRPDLRDVVPYMEIMTLVDVEAWLQAWVQPSSRTGLPAHLV